MSAIRSLARTVAHNRMKEAGYVRVNKVSGGSSFFADNWREFASGKQRIKVRTDRKRGKGDKKKIRKQEVKGNEV